ncbi:large conductance mechanosensitive channel protein MscL [Flavobacteriaceae bacterium TP-CH-4]|uniref:Large-conductance mechanosensitive channel n=1 Tax=Pelagihabitans pacificus TaxID=2696054 RepID=A0A967ATP5_9FLAO|nr:large conductance mechanosensitive channel protein MscL [Pelagihabitans pacificus]NHF60201.1 large conductance mechanosensitive channel protein MscL [Pelagihabitans pacificus]
MKNFVKEFKNFAVKGNMVDMAIGIIIGTAFNNVVNVLVKKVAMPPLSLLTNNVTLANKKWVLREAGDTVEEVAIGYGELLEVVIDFGVIALTIFVVLKAFNKFKDKAEDPKDEAVKTPKDIELLASMEQLMKEQNSLLKQLKE